MGCAALYDDQQQKLMITRRNLARQYEFIRKAVEQSDGPLKLTSDHIKELHRVLMQDLYVCAGKFRDRLRQPRRSSVRITGSKHKPLEDDYVPDQVEQLCETVNGLATADTVWAATMTMWKLAWIHPFYGGHGRTSRAAGYLVLCVGLKKMLPGSPTILEMLSDNRDQYLLALADADAAWELSGVPDVSRLLRMIDEMLRRQLSPA
jgi:Fic family protein